VGEAVASAWRWVVTDVRHLGRIDFKWLVFGFLVTAVVTWLVREVTLRRLQHKNRLLRLLVDVEGANAELLRFGSELQIDTYGFHN
jgi:hypothetical protein